MNVKYAAKTFLTNLISMNTLETLGKSLPLVIFAADRSYQRAIWFSISKGNHKGKVSKGQHKKVVHFGIKLFTCEICNKTFARNSHLLTLYKPVHFEIRPFSCDTCNKSFASNSVLTQHKKIVHSGIKPFACDICNKSFTKNCDLTRHKK